MRQVLNALDGGEPVHWTPAAGARPLGRPSHGPRYAVAALVTLTAIAGGVWLVGVHPAIEPGRGMLAAVPSLRLAQIAATAQPRIKEIIEPISSTQRTPELVAEEAVEVEAGKRTRLSARVLNDDAVEPETVVLVMGLPDDVRLSDGIMIEHGLWMLRPDLLSSVEVDAGTSAGGDYELTLELRTSEGTVVSAGRTKLVVAPARNDTSKPDATARASEEPAKPQAISPSSRQASRPAQMRKAPPKKIALQKPSERRVVARKAPAEPKVKVAKAVRRTRPAVSSEVTVLASQPAVPQGPQQSRLVWPGDDPRTGSYAPNPPVFLGGVVPGTAAPQAKPPFTSDEARWRRRMFGP
jgi:hypothetical protein